jgi:hypothetical protein
MRLPVTFFFLTLLFTAFTGCSDNKNGKLPADIVHNPNSAGNDDRGAGLPILEFEQEEHDFGKIIQGEVVTYGFKFRNTGKGDLIISQVSSTCGCTVTNYTQGTIKPGNEGVIEVTFNSEGRKGFQSKAINVVSNTQPNIKKLTIKAQVVVPEE